MAWAKAKPRGDERQVVQAIAAARVSRPPQANMSASISWLERDELSLNRLLIPFVPAEAGTQFFGRVLGPWIPASEAVNLSILGDFGAGSNTLGLMVRKRATAGAACVNLAAMRAVSNHGSRFRTRGHPSRRPRFARAPQDEVGVVKIFTASQAGIQSHLLDR